MSKTHKLVYHPKRFGVNVTNVPDDSDPVEYLISKGMLDPGSTGKGVDFISLVSPDMKAWKQCAVCGCAIEESMEVCPVCAGPSIIPQPGLFRIVPRPWRYDPNTHNVICADGAIVCRCGDSVYDNPLIGETIVRVFNAMP